MKQRCESCEWGRDMVWHYQELELSTIHCTLGNTCLAQDCKDYYPELPEEMYAGTLSYSRKVEQVFPVPIMREEG